MKNTSGLMQAHGIVAVNSQHPRVKKLKREGHVPNLHGTKVWRSSFSLMEYFNDFPLPQNVNVMDVGCGWGVISIFLAKTFNANVLGVDADAAVAPYLQLQAELNQVEIAFKQAKLQQLTQQGFEGYHTVIGADICFWDELTKPLYNMIRRALRAGVKQIIIADPGRPPFWELAEMCGEKLNAEVLCQTTTEPVKTKKQLLIIESK